MLKQREIYKIIILEPAKSRIARGECPSCGKPKSKWNRRTDWRCCCEKCTDKFERDKIIRSWPELRMKAIERDKSTCQMCGKIPRMRIALGGSLTKEHIEKKYKVLGYESSKYGWENAIVDLPDGSELIGDHIKPIALGGDEWDLNNVQTLCIPCNKIKTREDIKLIAIERKKEKNLTNGQQQIGD